MTKAQIRKQATLDSLQGWGVFFAAWLGVMFRRFMHIYRTTGSLDTFLGEWPEMVIASVTGLMAVVGIDSIGNAKTAEEIELQIKGKRGRWWPRMIGAFVAGAAADGFTGDVF